MTREEAIINLKLSQNRIGGIKKEEWNALQMAIEALSAEAKPMTEEVREALMRLTMCAREDCVICKYKDKCNFDFQYEESTKNMNTILDSLMRSKCEVDAEWIPCSERLPSDSGDYLVCPSDGVIEDYSDCRDVMIMPYDADCEAFGWWTDRYDPISLGFVDSDFNEFEVLAWMPLPMPYKGSGK